MGMLWSAVNTGKLFMNYKKKLATDIVKRNTCLKRRNE
jgi:hypothetical protein